MKILCIEQYGNAGGGQRMLLDLIPGFLEQGWETRVAVPQQGPLVSMLKERGVDVDLFAGQPYTKVHKPFTELARYAWHVEQIRRVFAGFVQAHRPDLLYVNGPRYLPPAALVARQYSIPVVFHCHHRLSQKLAVMMTGRALRYATARVIACCRFAVEPLERYLPPQRIHVIYNGTAEMPVRPAAMSRNSKTIGVIGRIEAEKGQREFVAAARNLAHDFPDLKFLVVGASLFSDDTYFDAVMQEAAGLPVEFCGWTDDIASVFSNLDLLIVPSTGLDATPRVILEAFASKVPVVAFPSGGIPEIIEDGQTGFLADSVTPGALAARIAEVLRMPACVLENVAQNAYAASRDRFGIAAFRRSICTAIEETYAERRPNSARRSPAPSGIAISR